MLTRRAGIPVAAAVAVLVGAASCQCDSGSGTPANRDSREARHRRPADATAPTRHALAGTWSGSALTPSHGLVVATVAVDDRGSGMAVLTARGVTVTESFALESWDGRFLRVRYRDATYTLTAELDGSVLYVDVPIAGWVRLARKSREVTR
jgi:hypothetical protein